ncbi:hypothetical protein D3C77_613610 [compost metagenome]
MFLRIVAITIGLFAVGFARHILQRLGKSPHQTFDVRTIARTFYRPETIFDAVVGTGAFHVFALEIGAVVRMQHLRLAPDRPLTVHAVSNQPFLLWQD